MNPIRIRSRHLALALLACAASGGAIANPMPGGSIYIPRVSPPPAINYSGTADAGRAGVDGARTSIDTGGVGQAGPWGRFAAGAGAVNGAPGGGFSPIDGKNNWNDEHAQDLIQIIGGIDPFANDKDSG